MARLLIFLLLLSAGYGVFQLVLDYKARQKADRNPWVQRFTTLLGGHASGKLLAGQYPDAEKTFLQLMHAAHQAEQDGFSLLQNLKQAAVEAGNTSTEAALTTEAVIDNLERARGFGIFDDPANLLRLERGEPPLAAASGWEGERLTIGHKISPLFGAELYATLSNMVIMPESVRNMQNETVPPEAPALTSRWLRPRIISPQCASAIRAQIQLDTSR